MKSEKCCETCRYFVEDFSTGQPVCNCPDEDIAEWVKQKEEDVWTTDYDYCNKYQEASNDFMENKNNYSEIPTEQSPLEIYAPRGIYYVWTADNRIYGSVEKPDPSKNIVNARMTMDFTAQGFENIDEVVTYVRKYF